METPATCFRVGPALDRLRFSGLRIEEHGSGAAGEVAAAVARGDDHPRAGAGILRGGMRRKLRLL